MLFAIVDIETTGSYAAGSGITEIAIIIHDGREVLSTYETLINPHRPIPRFIQSLTGITPDMVANAPSFGEVAGQIHELLQDKIFVAHNVNFDYSFVKHHLDRCGYPFDARKLCTVRMARKIVPGFPSYSLGRLCHSLEIAHNDHHRAGGDAKATAILFSLLAERDTDGVINTMLKGRNKEQYLPPHVPVEQLDNLPATPGVYYFYNAAGKIIYVGKAINLNQRVKSHFANNKASRQKQDFMREIYRISHQPTATDLMAHVLESVEIRRLWPVHNRSQKGYLPKFGLFMYEDQQGFMRLVLDKNKNVYKPVHTFNTLAEGIQWLRDLVQEFGLCARLCNLITAPDCMGSDFQPCGDGDCPAKGCVESYNDKVKEALGWFERMLPTMALVDAGRMENERSCILIVKGEFAAMGYLSGYADDYSLKALQQQLDPYPDNDYIRNMLYRHAADNPHKCLRWDGEQWTGGGRKDIPQQVLLPEYNDLVHEAD
jgi:DNA polymerase-3 subunit epsilon